MKVGPKGQVVIEKELRDALGVRAGSLASQRLVGDHIEIRFYPAEHEVPLRGILARETKHKVDPESWGAAVQRAWDAAVADHVPMHYEAAEPKSRQSDET